MDWQKFLDEVGDDPIKKGILESTLKAMGIFYDEITFNFLSKQPMEVKEEEFEDYIVVTGTVGGEEVFTAKLSKGNMATSIENQSRKGLKDLLQKAIEIEDYETAAEIRDKLNETDEEE